jgi:hypothetical protein
MLVRAGVDSAYNGTGEAVERTVAFDIDHIVRDDLEELEVRTRPAPVDAHYTEIMLSGLHKPPQGRTIGKIKDHLASIYRVFIREGPRSPLRSRNPLLPVAVDPRRALLQGTNRRATAMVQGDRSRLRARSSGSWVRCPS